jgi:hypothetical protein
MKAEQRPVSAKQFAQYCDQLRSSLLEARKVRPQSQWRNDRDEESRVAAGNPGGGGSRAQGAWRIWFNRLPAEVVRTDRMA